MGIKSSVSLYSLQYQFLQGKMSLEDILIFMNDLHVDGIEILPDQMLKGTPTPSEETYAMWDALMGKYHPGLACDDIFLNTNLYKNIIPLMIFCAIFFNGGHQTVDRVSFGLNIHRQAEGSQLF